MLSFKLVYSDAYYLPIGEHVFPAEKYRRIRDRLIAADVADPTDFLEPQPATDQAIGDRIVASDFSTTVPAAVPSVT